MLIFSTCFLLYSAIWVDTVLFTFQILELNLYHSVIKFDYGMGSDATLWGIQVFQNEKSFFDEIKDTFHSFGRAIIWWKNKNLIKNSGHKL